MDLYQQKIKWREPGIIPGFSKTFGFTVFYLSIIVLIPLSGLFWKMTEMSFAEFYRILSSPRIMHAYYVSFGTAFIASIINVFFGLIVAWILVRYDFWGKKFCDALLDLPFALPTAVTGIALSTIYAPQGWIGSFFEIFGMKIAFTPIGIVIALIVVGLPFVVRTVQPVLEDMDIETEEAAANLGANRWQIFYKVLLPHLTPALITGFAMAFARSVGEYGSVIFIAGNMPYVSEIVPLLIAMKLEQFDEAGAAALAVIMLCFSFSILFFVNWLQRRARKRWGGSRT